MRFTPPARALLLLTIGLAACGQPERRSNMTLPEENELKRPASAGATQPAPLRHQAVDTPLPPPTMSNQQIRQAMWDIAARQLRGDVAKVLSDYQAKVDETHSLEARFLAAMAIADDEEQWRALYSLWEEYPKYPWVHAGMASVYAKWKIRDQCEREVNLTLEDSPDLLWAYTIRGDLYRRLGENQLALRDYEVAVRGDPLDADARVGLALTRRALGQTDRLREELEQALHDVPTHYEAAENLATLLDDAGDPQALGAWERLGELAPRNRTAQLAIARLCATTDATRAAAAYEKAAKTGPLTKTEEETLAKLYRKLNRPDDEIRALQVITKLDTKDVNPLRRIAECYVEKKDWSAAEQAFQAVLQSKADDPDALLGIGRALEKHAELRKAIEYYRRAVKAGAPGAKSELTRLSEECMLPTTPITGRNYDVYYANVMDSLQKMYARRLEDAPKLKGQLKLRVEQDTHGHIVDLDVTENSLNDPWLEAHLYYSVLDSRFPPFDRTKFGMPFPLSPGGK